MFHVKHIKGYNMKLNELLGIIPTDELVTIGTGCVLYSGNIANIPYIIISRDYDVIDIVVNFDCFDIRVKEV